MKKTAILVATGCALTLLNSCQTMNSAMVPSARTSSDDFDGSKIVRQEPVSSSSSLTEDWHTLGFDWSSRTPDKVFLTAGVRGTNNVFGLAFNAGGKLITAQPASLTTEYGPWSTRRFVVSFREFEAIANAPLVKMKVSGANAYGVSSFGSSTNAVVGTKFPSFLQQVNAAR